MTKSAAEAFDTFIGWLTPTEADRAKASTHRQSVYDKLNSKYGLFRMFQSGSFSHGTGVRNYSDVDYFVSLKSDRPQLSSSILTSVKNTLQERFPATTIRVARPAVVVEFGGGYETYEIIPAYAQGNVAGSENMRFKIPGVTTEWLDSTPEAHLSYVNDCNAKPKRGHAKSFARLIKAWKYKRSVPVSSFYLEMRAAQYIAEQKEVVYAYDLYFFLKWLQEIGLRSMNDPTGSTGQIKACSSDAKLSEAKSKLDTAVSRANNALEAHKKGKEDEAFTYWDLLFNGAFPAYY